MITVCEGFEKYFLHYCRFSLMVKFPEGLIVLLPIDKLDVYRYITLTHQEIIDDHSSDSAITVIKGMYMLECQMKPGEPLSKRIR